MGGKPVSHHPVPSVSHTGMGKPTGQQSDINTVLKQIQAQAAQQQQHTSAQQPYGKGGIPANPQPSGHMQPHGNSLPPQPGRPGTLPSMNRSVWTPGCGQPVQQRPMQQQPPPQSLMPQPGNGNQDAAPLTVSQLRGLGMAQIPQHMRQNAALLNLLNTLKNPLSPEVQQQVLQILKSNPQLMALCLKQKNPQPETPPNQQQLMMQNQHPAPPMGAPPPQQGGQQFVMPPQQTPPSQQQQQQQWFSRQQLLALQRRQQQQQQQQQQQPPQYQSQQFQQPVAPPYSQGSPRQRAPHHMQFYQQSDYPQPQLLQQQPRPMSPGNMLSQQQHTATPSPGQQLLQQVRSPPPNVLGTTVRSPNPSPCPPHPAPSPRQPHPSPHHSPYGGGMVAPPTVNQQESDQVMLSQVQMHATAAEHMPNMSNDSGVSLQDQLARCAEGL